jgi:hypothetical protein
LEQYHQQQQSVSTPELSKSKYYTNIKKKSKSITPLFKSFYVKNYTTNEFGKKSIFRNNFLFNFNLKNILIYIDKNNINSHLCSKTYNIIVADIDNEDSKLNNFNTDFYKLCSESYINGSDLGLCASISSLNNLKKVFNNEKTKHSSDKIIRNSLTFPNQHVHNS